MRGMRSASACAALVCVILSCSAAAAEDLFELHAPVSSVFMFGGILNGGNLGQTLLVVGNSYENSGIAGAAYRSEFISVFDHFELGLETGGAARFGDGTSGEFWGGPSLTYNGLNFGWINVAPSGVFGLSAITSPTGVERARAIEHGGNETLLFYIGLEVAFSSPATPSWELVYRVHHRSGGYGTLGGVLEGHNANVIGFRHRF